MGDNTLTMASLRKVLRRLKNGTVQIGKLRVLDDTFVVARQETDVSLSADTPTQIPFDVEERDELDEFSGGVFTPTETGWYKVDLHAEFQVNTSGDELKLSIYDNDAADTIFESEIRANGTGNRDRSLNATVKMEEGKGYEIQAENSDNPDTISGKPKRTRLTISKDPSGFNGS